MENINERAEKRQTVEGGHDGKRLLMLRKKSEELAKVFKEILEKPDSLVGKRSQTHRKLSSKESILSLSLQSKNKKLVKERGHHKVPRLGQDLHHDHLEKRLIKLATKGVVQIFNTVSKLNKEEKIRCKEAVPKPISPSDDDNSVSKSPKDDSQWDVLQDSYLEQVEHDSDGEEWDQESNSVDLEDSLDTENESD